MGPVVQGDAITGMEVGSHLIDAAKFMDGHAITPENHEWVITFSKPMPHVPEVFVEVDTTSVIASGGNVGGHESLRATTEVFKVSKTGFTVRALFAGNVSGTITGMYKINWLAISRKLDEHAKLLIPGIFDWPTYEPYFRASTLIDLPAIPAGFKFTSLRVTNTGGPGADVFTFLASDPRANQLQYNKSIEEVPPGSGVWKLSYTLKGYDLDNSKRLHPNGLPYQIEAEPLFTGHDVTSHYDGPPMTKGMYSMDEDGNKFYWDGTKWVAGVHP
jgi:hypothetical protein